MGKNWMEEIRKRIEENLSEAIDEMDEDEIKEAIRDAIDFGQLVKEVISEDNNVRNALKNKVREELTEIINHLDEMDFEDGSLDDVLMNNIDMEKEIKEVLNSDEELKKDLHEKIKKAVVDNLENFDGGDLPEWDDFKELLNINDVVRKISTAEDFQKLLAEKVQELMKSLVSDNVSENDLPENVLELIGLKDQVKKALENNEFKQALGDYLKDSIRKGMLDMVSLKNINLSVFLKDDLGFKNVVSRQISELLRDPKIVSKIRKNLKLELVGKEYLKERIMGIFLAK